MKTITAVLAALFLAGCVTGAITPIGKDRYMLSATRCGACEPVQGFVTETAGKYCVSRGENLVVRNITGNNLQPWVPGNATIEFSCLNADDPDYTATKGAKGAAIQEH